MTKRMPRFAATVPWTGLVVGLGGCLVLFRALLAGDAGALLWGDSLDPNLIYWVLEWGYHVLFQLRDPLHFFDANAFYPLPHSLAVSDAFLSAQVFYSPLRWFGVPPLVALYVTLGFAVAVSAPLTDQALKRLGVTSASERAVVTLAGHLSLPVTTLLAHYQCFAWQFAPPFFLYLLLYLRDWRPRDLAMVSGLYCVAVAWAIYLAPMLLTLSLVVAAPTVVQALRKHGPTAFLKHVVGAKSAAIIIAFAAALYILVLRFYFAMGQTFVVGSYNATNAMSATRYSLFNGFSIHSYWYNPGGYAFGGWERAYFPGFVLLGGLGLSLAVWAYRRYGGRRPFRWPALAEAGVSYSGLLPAMTWLFLAAWVLSFGPSAKQSGMPLPFMLAMKLIPGMENIRAPGRFGIFLGLPLGIFLIYGMRCLIASARGRTIAARVLLLALAIESLPNHAVTPFSIPRRPVYEQVGRLIEPGAPLLELPVSRASNFETLIEVTNQLKGSTLHWGRLVVGYGGTETADYREVLTLSDQLRAGGLNFAGIWTLAKRLGVPYVLVHKDELAAPVVERWLATAADASLVRERYELGESLLLKLNLD